MNTSTSTSIAVNQRPSSTAVDHHHQGFNKNFAHWGCASAVLIDQHLFGSADERNMLIEEEMRSIKMMLKKQGEEVSFVELYSLAAERVDKRMEMAHRVFKQGTKVALSHIKEAGKQRRHEATENGLDKRHQESLDASREEPWYLDKVNETVAVIHQYYYWGFPFGAGTIIVQSFLESQRSSLVDFGSFLLENGFGHCSASSSILETTDTSWLGMFVGPVSKVAAYGGVTSCYLQQSAVLVLYSVVLLAAHWAVPQRTRQFVIAVIAFGFVGWQMFREIAFFFLAIVIFEFWIFCAEYKCKAKLNGKDKTPTKKKVCQDCDQLLFQGRIVAFLGPLAAVVMCFAKWISSQSVY